MTKYLTLENYLLIAEEVTGISAEVLLNSDRTIKLADSAIHAPMHSFGHDDLYTDIIDKAAVLCYRLVSNHPLPDGNKRAAWLSLRVFIETNQGRWYPDPPDVDEAEKMMFALAADEIDQQSLATWIKERTVFN